MAYASLRSCNSDLHRGMADGTYKFARPDAGGVVEDTTAAVRRQMYGVWHGFRETPSKVLPDGKIVSTIDYQDVSPSSGDCGCM
jgi:hypothetical protein